MQTMHVVRLWSCFTITELESSSSFTWLLFTALHSSDGVWWSVVLRVKIKFIVNNLKSKWFMSGPRRGEQSGRRRCCEVKALCGWMLMFPAVVSLWINTADSTQLMLCNELVTAAQTSLPPLTLIYHWLLINLLMFFLFGSMGSLSGSTEKHPTWFSRILLQFDQQFKTSKMFSLKNHRHLRFRRTGFYMSHR